MASFLAIRVRRSSTGVDPFSATVGKIQVFQLRLLPGYASARAGLVGFAGRIFEVASLQDAALAGFTVEPSPQQRATGRRSKTPLPLHGLAIGSETLTHTLKQASAFVPSHLLYRSRTGVGLVPGSPSIGPLPRTA